MAQNPVPKPRTPQGEIEHGGTGGGKEEQHAQDGDSIKYVEGLFSAPEVLRKQSNQHIPDGDGPRRRTVCLDPDQWGFLCRGTHQTLWRN